MKQVARVRSRLAASLFALSPLLLLLAACSLGEGVTADCILTDDPDSPEACRQVAQCDDFDGFVKPEQGCCEEAAELQFGLCAKTTVVAGSYADCQADTSGACCNALQQEFNSCMARQPGSGGSSAGGSNAGGANAGGAGQGGNGGS